MRTGLEVTVVLIGLVLGGVLGVGTVLYALAIGPVTQALLPASSSTSHPVRGEAGPGLSVPARRVERVRTR